MKFKKVRFLFVNIFILSLTLFLIAGCGNKKYKIYASFYTMKEFTNMILQGDKEVGLVTPTSSEPHDFDLTPKLMQNIIEADVLIYNGLGIEHWLNKLQDNTQNNNLKYVNSSQYIDILADDPHVWLDPLNAVSQLTVIKDELISIYQNKAELYEANYQKAVEELGQLHEEYEQAIATFTKKEIVVSHKAYGYLCERYGLEQYEIANLHEDEPTTSQIKDIIELIKDKNIEYIFTDEMSSTKALETIKNETGVEILLLSPIESSINKSDTYLSLMRSNLTNLKKALV